MRRIDRVLCAFVFYLAFSANVHADPHERESAGDRTVNATPRKPQPGDKLGYSKEESTRRLDPEVRQLFDALLRLYREPGLFTDRRMALSIVGVDHIERRWHSRYDNMPDKEPMHFDDIFAKEGIFARPGWSGKYYYGGWREKGRLWFAGLYTTIDQKIECIDSRAVEGSLDVYLQPGLRTGADATPRELWNRHGIFGSPYAFALGELTPHIGMSFSHGCLLSIGVYKGFNYTEVSDEHVVN